MIKVSIIIPTHNRVKELTERCLPSIWNQAYKDYELIIWDDASTDETQDKLKFRNLRYFRNPRNMGKSYSVNQAVKQAKGEYILVVDDDNELHPKYLELAVETIERESAKEMKWSNSEWHALNTGRIVVHDGYTDYAPAYYQQGLGFTAIDWGWLIRKKVFNVIQYDETLFGDEDADFGIQFYKNFRAYALDMPLQTAYATGNDGVSLPTEKRLQSLERFVEKNWKEYEDSGPADLSFLYRFTARNFYLAGNKQKAKEYFWKCFKAWPTRRTLTHYLVSLINYKAYYLLMRLEEKYYSKKRLKNYGLTKLHKK